MIDFNGGHFERDAIPWGVRRHVTYPMSYRQLEEMMEERGVEVEFAKSSTPCAISCARDAPGGCCPCISDIGERSYGWFRELARRFLFQTIHDVALMLDRERQAREASPSAAVIDSQSIKAPHAETRSYDAGKKIVGRKRHIAVDTDGRLLMVNLTTADVSDIAPARRRSSTPSANAGRG